MRPTIGLLVSVSLVGSVFTAAQSRDPMAPVPAERRASLTKRMEAYVKANQNRKWDSLYDLVSQTGRGGVDRSTFVVRMNAAHGRDFANAPDLLAFRIERVNPREDSGFDLYGCGKAQREGRTYNGVAVAHAVFEHDEWFFTGWSFTRFPNEQCEALARPDWRPKDEDQIPWKLPMVEVRPMPGVPFHLDRKP